MTIERAKRRTISQIIGKKGEALFQYWVIGNHITSAKIEDDFGIDFFGQVMRPVAENIEEATGQVLAIQVRSIEGKNRKSIKLDRVDVENALRIQIPYCLVGIDISVSTVYYKFLDLKFLNKLCEFLLSKHNTISLSLNKFSSDKNNFFIQLTLIAQPGYQQKLRWYKTALDIQHVIPDGRLEITQKMKGGYAVVSAPWLTSFFQVEPKAQKQVSKIFFEEGKMPGPGFPGFKLRDEVSYVPNLIDGHTYLMGGMEADVELLLVGRDIIKKSLVKYRKIGDERAYISPAGLILIISDRRNVGGEWVHELYSSVTDVDVVSLGDKNSDIDFLKNIRKGFSIGEDKDHLIPIENWGNLEFLSKDVEAIEKVCNQLNFSLDSVFLKDILNKEFLLIIDLIRAFIEKIPISSLIRPFLIGPPAESVAKKENWHEAGFRVPIVANLKDKGVIVWIEGKGDLYLDYVENDDRKLICGFRALSLSNWSTELRNSRFPHIKMPELWLYKDWPGIPLFPENESFEFKYEGEPFLEFDGDAWLL